jgi:ribosomal protein L4
MKIHILDKYGNKAKEIQTGLFEEPVREDLLYKIVEAEKIKHPSRPRLYAGMDRSASGKVQHKRHSWNTDRGRGMPRIPKKTMWRRGTQFSWIGAIVPSTRGGRRAHPPKGFGREKKINKKEYIKALLSSLSYISNIDKIKNRYQRLSEQDIKIKLPIVVEDKILSLKTKDQLIFFKKILGILYDVSIQKRAKRPGKGKLRGRRNKSNAGAVIVIGKNEKIKLNGFEIVKVNVLTVSDLVNGGARVAIFSENAIKELEDKLIKGNKTK